jgi:hypothetical protein
MIKSGSLALGLCILLSLFSSCGANKISGTNINELLQGSNGHWERYKKFTDTDNSLVEKTYMLVFKAPDIYRWKEFGERDGEEAAEMSFEESGTYVIAESTSKIGTIDFTPGSGDIWVASFEVLRGSGDLLITKPDGESIQFEWIRTTLGIAY